jgi:hypothetical protein
MITVKGARADVGHSLITSTVIELIKMRSVHQQLKAGCVLCAHSHQKAGRRDSVASQARATIGARCDAPPAVFSTDILIGLKAQCEVPLSPFSVSGEYARFALPDGWDWRFLTELFTMSAGRSQPDHYLRRR